MAEGESEMVAMGDLNEDEDFGRLPEQCHIISNYNMTVTGRVENLHVGPLHNSFKTKKDKDTGNAIVNKKSPKKNKEFSNKEVQQLRIKLREDFKKARLPLAKWMEGEESIALSDYYVQLQLTNSQENIKIHNLFDGIESKRLLIESQPGFGKTTLSTKIVYDWAKGEKYLKKFEFAFFQPLNEMNNMGDVDFLSAITKGYDIGNKVRFKKYVEKNSSKMLFVLDGYDEITDQIKKQLEPLLYSKILKDATVIVTCRTGLFSSKYLLRFVCEKIRKKEFYDKCVTIKGVNNPKEFFSKFVTTEKSNLAIEFIKKETHNVIGVFRSPLLLTLLVFIIGDSNERSLSGRKIQNATDFYELLINYIVKRSLSRNRELVDDTFNIFNKNDLHASAYLKEISEFGYSCLEYLLKGELEFEENDQTRKMYNLGLLMCNKSKENFLTRVSYKFFHKSFMEFVAACYILGELSQKKIDNRLTNVLRQSRSNLSDTSLVLQFSFDMLDKYYSLSPRFRVCNTILILYTYPNENGFVNFLDNDISLPERWLKYINTFIRGVRKTIIFFLITVLYMQFVINKEFQKYFFENWNETNVQIFLGCLKIIPLLLIPYVFFILPSVRHFVAIALLLEKLSAFGVAVVILIIALLIQYNIL